MRDRQGNRSRYDTEVVSWCMFGHESASRMAYESPGEYPAKTGENRAPTRAGGLDIRIRYDTVSYRISRDGRGTRHEASR
jgi:hypothetical protein